MENKKYYKDMPANLFKTLAGYHATKKRLWHSRGLSLSPPEIKELIAIQKLTDELHPELNYLFKKH